MEPLLNPSDSQETSCTSCQPLGLDKGRIDPPSSQSLIDSGSTLPSGRDDGLRIVLVLLLEIQICLSFFMLEVT